MSHSLYIDGELHHVLETRARSHGYIACKVAKPEAPTVPYAEYQVPDHVLSSEGKIKCYIGGHWYSNTAPAVGESFDSPEISPSM